jgi:hypothetical protein
VRFFEEVLPMTVAASVHRYRSPVLQADHVEIQRELRAILIAVLPPAQAADTTLVESLDAVMSIDLWRRLRLEQKLPVDAATEILRRLVGALVPAA